MFRFNWRTSANRRLWSETSSLVFRHTYTYVTPARVAADSMCMIDAVLDGA